MFVSIQAKHNLALRAEYMTKLDLTLNDCQTIESQVINRPQQSEGAANVIPLQERDIVNISLDEVFLNKQNYITMQLT